VSRCGLMMLLGGGLGGDPVDPVLFALSDQRGRILMESSVLGRLVVLSRGSVVI